MAELALHGDLFSTGMVGYFASAPVGGQRLAVLITFQEFCADPIFGGVHPSTL
jgi:hypothetical protein